MFRRLRLLIVVLLGFVSLSAHSFGLTYRVMNASSAVVKFNSTDWLDWGTRIYSGETKANTYYFAPKNMYLTLYNSSWERFTISIDPSCDLLGLPPLRQQSDKLFQVKGSTLRLASGTIDIVIKDLPGSSYYNKKISCSVVASDAFND